VRLNWYRGFYRVWMVSSLLWIALWGALAIGVTYQQQQFNNRVAAARASDPEAANHGGLLLNWRGEVCKGDWFDRNAPDCTLDPAGPHPTTDLLGFWIGIFAVPAAFYAMLRAAAWIFRGFGRNSVNAA